MSFAITCKKLLFFLLFFQHHALWVITLDKSSSFCSVQLKRVLCLCCERKNSWLTHSWPSVEPSPSSFFDTKPSRMRAKVCNFFFLVFILLLDSTERFSLGVCSEDHSLLLLALIRGGRALRVVGNLVSGRKAATRTKTGRPGEGDPRRPALRLWLPPILDLKLDCNTQEG